MKSRGFSKLRIAGLAGAVGAVAVGPAAQGGGAMFSTREGDAFWKVSDNAMISFSYASGGVGLISGIPCTTTTTGPSTTVTTHCPPLASPSVVDPFVAGLLAEINNVTFKDTDGILDTSGNTATAIGKTKGFKVTQQYAFFPDSVVRVSILVKNPKSTTRKMTLRVGSQLISSNIAIDASSDGNNSFEPDDSWATLKDGDGVKSHAAVLLAQGDCHANVVDDTLATPPFSNIYKTEYSMKLRPKKTLGLMFLVKLGTTGSLAGDGEDFEDRPAMELKGYLMGVPASIDLFRNLCPPS